MITVDDILKCKKIIDKKRRPELQLEHRHYRMNIELTCNELDVKMIMFIRKLAESPNKDFTVGLRIAGPSFFANHDTVIVRFQGPHGGQSAARNLSDLHNNYHMHLYTEDDRIHHRKLAKYKEAATFNSFEQAVVDFLAFCNIEDSNGIFDYELELTQQFKMDLENL